MRSETTENPTDAIDPRPIATTICDAKKTTNDVAVVDASGATATLHTKAFLVAFGCAITATVLIESRAAKVVSIEEVYGIEGGKSEYYHTQFEILKSRSLAERVVRKLELRQLPEFNGLSCIVVIRTGT